MNDRVYISGQMTGLKREEYIANFKKAEELLRVEGYEHIVNPTKFYVCRFQWLYRIMGYRLTLLYDLWKLMKCDRIYLIPGWQDSTGAKIESFVAFNLKIRRVPQDAKEKIDKKIAKWMNSLKSQQNDTVSRRNRESRQL